MTIKLFIMLFAIGAAVSALLTEAIKKTFENAGKETNPNVLALIDAIVIGCGGTAIAYILMDIPWNLDNIVCLILMSLFVWIGSVIGYDKVMELLDNLPSKSKEE